MSLSLALAMPCSRSLLTTSCFHSLRHALFSFSLSLVQELSGFSFTPRKPHNQMSDLERVLSELLFRFPLSFPASLSALLDNHTRDQALDLLVSATSTRYRASSADLSTLSSSRGLTSLRCGNLYLKVGFTLRCLQRLSLPHFASLLCRWHDNSFTSDASIPVLSY